VNIVGTTDSKMILKR